MPVAELAEPGLQLNAALRLFACACGRLRCLRLTVSPNTLQAVNAAVEYASIDQYVPAPRITLAPPLHDGSIWGAGEVEPTQ